MASGVFTGQFTVAGGPYNIFQVITGAQTTGVTKKTGCTTVSPYNPVNVTTLDLSPTTEVAGKVYVGDRNVSATNKNGVPVVTGDTLSYGVGHRGTICLSDEYFAPDTDNIVIAIAWK